MSNMTFQCNKCGRIFKEKGEASGLSAGKAVIGGFLAGPVGAVVGASMGKRERNTCCPYCGAPMFHVSRIG